LSVGQYGAPGAHIDAKTANHYSKAQYAPLKDLKKPVLLQPTRIDTDPGADLATLNKS